MSAYAYRRIIDAIGANDLNGNDRGAQALYQCPAHDDRTPSLSITDKDDRALVHCHAGCDTLDVLDALGLDWSDLFDEPATGKGWTAGTLRRVGADVDGNGRVRLGSVAYLPSAAHGERKTLAAAGTTRDLWPDPATVTGQTLYVVEGEPDVVSATQLGLPAVAVPGTGKWAAGWAERLAAGRARVIVIADADEPGRRAARRCADAVAGHCDEVRLLDLAPERDDGYDLGNLVAEVGSGEAQQAAALIIRAAETAPRVGCHFSDLLGGVRSGTPGEFGSRPGDLGGATQGATGTPAGTLRILDVEAMLKTAPPPVPWVVEPLLAQGCATMLAGREGQGKSMLALALAAAIGYGADVAGLDCRPGRVLYVDAENGEREAHRRIHGVGGLAPGSLVYVEANGFSLASHLAELHALVEDRHPAVLVLDSLRSLAPGLDENDSQKAEAVLRPVVRLTQGCQLATLILHHAGKVGTEYRGSTAIGAAVELGFTLSRHPEDPNGARRRRLKCWKSRPAAEPPDHWLAIEPTDDGILLGEAEPFELRAAPREAAEEELIAALDGRPTSWAAWAREAGLDPKNGTARRARDRLHEQQRIRQDADGDWVVAS